MGTYSLLQHNRVASTLTKNAKTPNSFSSAAASQLVAFKSACKRAELEGLLFMICGERASVILRDPVPERVQWQLVAAEPGRCLSDTMPFRGDQREEQSNSNLAPNRDT
jgi:hypothetical protein